MRLKPQIVSKLHHSDTKIKKYNICQVLFLHITIEFFIFASFNLTTMENFNNIVCALQSVLDTQLLAKSRLDLAKKLGTGRCIFYRIVQGKASESAVENLLSILQERLYVDIHTLEQMEAAINNTAKFTKLVKEGWNSNLQESPYEVILAFIAHDYSHFSSQFRDGDLQQILTLERTDPRAFFNMLAYFYITSSRIQFYKNIKTKSHKERCAGVIEPLGKRLMSIYPSNGFGAGIAYAYSRSDVYNSEAQTLWSLIGRISSMFQAFASPIDTADEDCNYMLLPGLSIRSYWIGKNNDNIILVWLQPGKNPATGHYEVFCIDRQSGSPKGIASLFFINGEIISAFIKERDNSQLGTYRMDADTLSFQWEKSDDDPLHVGNTLTLLSLDASQSLRELDRALTDDALMREMARSEGLDYDFAMQPKDVVISRKKFSMTLNNGRSYSIDIDFAPFLRKLTPNEPLMICRQFSDNRIFAIWPQIHQSIPLNLFNSAQPIIPDP